MEKGGVGVTALDVCHIKVSDSSLGTAQAAGESAEDLLNVRHLLFDAACFLPHIF